MAISVDNATTQAVQFPATNKPQGAAVPAQATGSPQTVREPVVTQPPEPVEVKAPEGASLQELQEAIQNLSEYIQVVSRSLQINVNSDIGRPVVTVLDTDTSEVIRQIPTEEVIRLSEFIRSQPNVSLDAPSEDVLTGILLNQQS